jgi:hypothetical protein
VRGGVLHCCTNTGHDVTAPHYYTVALPHTTLYGTPPHYTSYRTWNWLTSSPSINAATRVRDWRPLPPTPIRIAWPWSGSELEVGVGIYVWRITPVSGKCHVGAFGQLTAGAVGNVSRRDDYKHRNVPLTPRRARNACRREPS